MRREGTSGTLRACLEGWLRLLRLCPIVVGILLWVTPAVAGGLLVSAGAGPAVATGSGEPRRFGAGMTIGYGYPLTGPLLAGLEVRRFHYDGMGHTTTSLSAFGRLAFREGRRLAPYVGLSLGGGLYTGCVSSGSCDGTGLAVAAAAGLSIPMGETVKLEPALATSVLFGMPGDARQLVMPTLQLGLDLSL